MLKKFPQINKTDAIYTAVLFAAFAALVYLFPYSGDDWAWGSQIGWQRLVDGFHNYNGRYGGNLLVMALTRSKLLNILVTSLFFVGICVLPRMFSDSKKFLPYAFGTLLFLLIPRQMFIQTIAWTAGFSNYVPPILMTMAYLVIVKNVFDEEKPHYHWLLSALSGVLGLVSALFMENVTLYNMVISAMLILYSLVKYKKVYFTHIAHLVGSIAGAVLMFSNSAYGLIAKGRDGYRSTAFSEGFKDTVTDHVQVIYQQFFNNNLPVLAIFSVLCIILYAVYARTCTNRKLKRVGALTALIHVFCFGILLAKHEYAQWSVWVGHPLSEMITAFFFAAVAALYFGSACFIVFLCVTEKKEKAKMLALLISIPILIAPLAFVNPIGARCFFPPFLMLICVCVMLLVYIQDRIKLPENYARGFALGTLAGCLAVFTLLFSLYATIHAYDAKRNSYVQKQIEAGYDTVTVCLLPYSSQVWCGNPNAAPWEERYKYFHGIDQNIAFAFIDHKAFDAWAASFDKNTAPDPGGLPDESA